ncbi:MAG: SMI1/KNR4 family protein [Bacteroidota bacterium]
MIFHEYLPAVIEAFDLKMYQSFQAKWQIQFPSEYLEVVRKHQGKIPEPNLFTYFDKDSKGESCLSTLFHFTNHPYKDVTAYSVWENTDNLYQFTGLKLIPFSEDPGGFPIAFDFRTKSANAPIVMINMEADSAEEAINSIAESFQHFWENLY